MSVNNACMETIIFDLLTPVLCCATVNNMIHNALGIQWRKGCTGCETRWRGATPQADQPGCGDHCQGAQCHCLPLVQPTASEPSLFICVINGIVTASRDRNWLVPQLVQGASVVSCVVLLESHGILPSRVSTCWDKWCKQSISFRTLSCELCFVQVAALCSVCNAYDELCRNNSIIWVDSSLTWSSGCVFPPAVVCFCFCGSKRHDLFFCGWSWHRWHLLLDRCIYRLKKIVIIYTSTEKQLF